MRRALADIALLVWKDLRIEARARAALPAMVVAGVLFVVVLAMGGGVARSGQGMTTILWAAYLVSGVLGVERGMAVERESDALSGVLLTPVDRGAVFLAKLVANLVVMAASAAVVSAVGIVLFGLETAGASWGFLAALGLGLVGLAALGTLFAAVIGGGSGRRGLLALLVLPLCVPLVVVSGRAAAAMVGGSPGAGPGLGVLVAFDVVYVVAGWLAFEHVVEV